MKMENSGKITAQEIRERFSYNPETGRVKHRNPSPRVKRFNGFVDGSGYRRFNGWGVSMAAAHIAHVIMTGDWPTLDIDHKNRDKLDNRWCNLRHVTRSVNNSNRAPYSKTTAGLSGVLFRKSTSRKHPDRVTWQVQVRNVYIGSFKTLLDAAAARIMYEDGV